MTRQQLGHINKPINADTDKDLALVRVFFFDLIEELFQK